MFAERAKRATNDGDAGREVGAAPLAGVALVVAAIGALLTFGVVGIGREGTLNFDGRVMYAAGRAWLAGLNPYDHDHLARAVAGLPNMDLTLAEFLYPPQAGALCVVIGALPHAAGRVVWLLFNLAAIAAIARGSIVLLERGSNGDRDRLGPWVLAAVVIGNPFTAHVVWMGQTSLLAFASTMWAWIFARSRRHVLAGLCLGLAVFKPQLSFLVVLWLLVDRDWRTLAIAAASALVLAAVPMFTQGPAGAFVAWIHGVRSGYDLPFNLPTAPHKVGLESLLAAGGVALPGVVSLALGFGAVIALWVVRAKIAWQDTLALIMAVTFTFSRHLHDYDYVGLAPAFASLWWWGRRRRALSSVLLALPLLLFVPHRLLRGFHLPVLEQWRTMVIFAAGAAIFALGRADSAGKTGPEVAPSPRPA